KGATEARDRGRQPPRWPDPSAEQHVRRIAVREAERLDRILSRLDQVGFHLRDNLRTPRFGRTVDEEPLTQLVEVLLSVHRQLLVGSRTAFNRPVNSLQLAACTASSSRPAGLSS